MINIPIATASATSSSALDLDSLEIEVSVDLAKQYLKDTIDNATVTMRAAVVLAEVPQYVSWDYSQIIASETAMAAITASETAMTAVAASETAMAAVIASDTALSAVVASETAMAAVIASETAMAAVIASETAMAAIVASETAMAAVIASETAMAAVIASETAMAAIVASDKALCFIAKTTVTTATITFFKALNTKVAYLQAAYDTVTGSNLFTLKTTNIQDAVSGHDQYGTASYAGKAIILTATGYFSSAFGYTTVSINGTQVSTNQLVNTERPTSVIRSNIGAVSVPTTTWRESGDGFAAIAVYTAK